MRFRMNWRLNVLLLTVFCGLMMSSTMAAEVVKKLKGQAALKAKSAKSLKMRISQMKSISKTMPPFDPSIKVKEGEAKKVDPEFSDEKTINATGLTKEQVMTIRNYWGVDNKTIVMMPHKARLKSLRKINKPKKAVWRKNSDGEMVFGYPNKAMEWRRESLVDENGKIPKNALSKAINHARAMRNNLAPKSNLWGTQLNFKTDAGLDKSKWTWLGPGNIGGRSRSLIIHPTNTSAMWIGSIAGGVWKTTDAGLNWTACDDFMSNLAVTTMVMDPNNSDIIYAGTGEGFFNADAIRGAGVFKTTDGGTTWSQIASTTGSDWYYVNRLTINSSGTLLAATSSGVFRSADSGAAWTQVLTGRYLDVIFDPNNDNNAICSAQDYSNGSFSSYSGYSVDSGLNWTQSNYGYTLSGRIELGYAKSSSGTLYALIDTSNGVVFRSTDGGANFSLIFQSSGDTQLLANGQGGYDNTIWIDPTNANVVVTGGIDLYRSTDAAVSFTKISTWQYTASYGSPHADHHYLVHHPGYDGTTNRTLYNCNDGGLYMTTDIYAANADQTNHGWQELNNNLGITQFYGAAGNPTSGNIVGGTQDNGSLQYTSAGGSEGWKTWQGGDGGYCAFDQNDSNYCYGEYVFLQIYRSTQGGSPASAAWYNEYICGQYVNGNAFDWKPAPYTIDDAKNKTAEFIAPFILDPNNQERLLAGGRSLWRSNDVKTANTDSSGPSWAVIKSEIGADSSANITAIAVAPSSSDIIWVGHRNGNVYKTTDGTQTSPTWTQMDGTSLPDRRCQSLTIDRTDSNVVYATFGGFSSGNVWKTSDGGTNWTSATGTGTTALPEAPVRSLVVHPTNSTWLYAGTEVGIFGSEDSGSTWSTANAGPTNCSVDQLFWLDNSTLVAASHGRGLFKITISGGSSTQPTIATDKSAFTPSTEKGKDASSETFQVWNSGSNTLSYTLSDDVNWLSLSASSGDSTSDADKDTITITYDTSSQTEGTHTAKITISSNDASNSPQTLTVTLTVTAPTGYDATIGTQFDVAATDCVKAGITEFAKKPKVYADLSGKKGTAKVLTKTYPATSVTCEWKKKASAGTYDLYVQPKEKGVKHDAEVVNEDFELKNPEIDNSTSIWKVIDTKTTSKGTFYTIELNLYGTYFGTKKPKVYVDYSDPRTSKSKSKRFKVTTKNPMSGNESTGTSSLVAIGKKIPADTQINGYLVNKIGQDSFSFTSTPNVVNSENDLKFFQTKQK